MASESTTPVLETPRLVLRGHRLGDFDDSAAMWADPIVVRHISGTPSSRETSWTRFLRYSGHWALLGFGYWVVEAKEGGRFIGEVGFARYERNIEPPLGDHPEAGWVLKASEFGQGFASEAVSRMLDWADDVARFDRTVCIFDPGHGASLRIARKAGFANEKIASYSGNPTMTMERFRSTN